MESLTKIGLFGIPEEGMKTIEEQHLKKMAENFQKCYKIMHAQLQKGQCISNRKQ